MRRLGIAVLVVACSTSDSGQGTESAPAAEAKTTDRRSQDSASDAAPADAGTATRFPAALAGISPAWQKLEEQAVQASKPGEVDVFALLGPFESLDQLCAVGLRDGAFEVCDYVEANAKLSPPFHRYAVVGHLRRHRMAVKTGKGWWVSGTSFVTTGLNPATRSSTDWLVHGVAARDAMLHVHWAKRMVSDPGLAPEPGKLARNRLRLCPSSEAGRCKEWFHLAFDGRERHLTICGVGKSGRPSCLDLRTTTEYGKVVERVSMKVGRKSLRLVRDGEAPIVVPLDFP